MAQLCIPSCPVGRLSSPQGGIQSPYVHRASGLLQIAVSTPLRTNSIGNRELLRAERCRYGTRDLYFCVRSAVDTALEIWHSLRSKIGEAKRVLQDFDPQILEGRSCFNGQTKTISIIIAKH